MRPEERNGQAAPWLALLERRPGGFIVGRGGQRKRRGQGGDGPRAGRGAVEAHVVVVLGGGLFIVMMAGRRRRHEIRDLERVLGVERRMPLIVTSVVVVLSTMLEHEMQSHAERGDARQSPQGQEEGRNEAAHRGFGSGKHGGTVADEKGWVNGGAGQGRGGSGD